MWVAQLLEHGLLRGSFVPPVPIREVRDPTRYRKALIQERTRVANRLHKALEDAGVKLASVASDILGVSGRAMLQALAQGTTDPAILADLARGRLRGTLPALCAALAGRFRSHHAFLVGQLLGHLDYLDEAIGTLSTELESRLAPFADQLTRLDSIPGINRRTAEVIIAEVGVDMSAFPSAAHLASWAANSSTHKTPAVHRWLARHPRFHLHFTRPAPLGSIWSSGGSPPSPKSRSVAGRTAVPANSRTPSAATSPSRMQHPSPSSGPRRRTKSSTASPAFVIESLTQDTRGGAA